MNTVLKRLLLVAMVLTLVVGLMPAAAMASVLPLEAWVSVDEDLDENALYCNPQNVACLAQTEFEVKSGSDGNLTVTVPSTEWSLAAVSSTRSYIAFSQSGTRLTSTDARLGSIELNEGSGALVIKRLSAFVSSEGSHVIFSGKELEIDDLPLAYSAPGCVGGTVDPATQRSALEDIELTLPEGVNAAVVDMPSLNATTAQIWSSWYHGDTLTMREYTGADDGDYATASFMFLCEKYAGYRPGISPLGGEGTDFLSAHFLDRWAVDREGYLWYVSPDGKQYFYETPYFAVAENAVNANAVLTIEAVDEKAAEGMAAEMKNVSSQPCVAISFKGFSGTIYYTNNIGEISYSLSDSTVSFTSKESVRFSVSYGLARDTKLYYNCCLNPSVPVSLQAGPISVDVYLSLGVSLDTAKFSFSFDKEEEKKTTVDLRTGKTLAEEVSTNNPGYSVSGGFSGEVKCFSTLVFGLGKRIANMGGRLSLASVDAGLGLGISVSGNMTSGCGDLTGELYPFLQAPSVYDGENVTADTAVNHPNFTSALKRLVKDIAVYLEPFGRLPLFNVHIEQGVRVDVCTKAAGCKIRSEDVTLLNATHIEYTGEALKPVVLVKKGNSQLTEGNDYDLSYSNNINAGIGCVTVRGRGGNAGRVMKAFTINPADIDDAEITGLGTYYFTGKEIKPLPAVKLNGKTLSNNKDCTLAYSNNVDRGYGFVEVTGKGNYEGTVVEMFFIGIEFPAVSVGVGTFSKMVKAEIKLKAKPKAPVSKVRICCAKTKAAALKWKGAVSKTVNLSAKGDSATLKADGLEPSTAYYIAADIAIKTPSGLHWKSDAGGEMVAKVVTESSKSVDEGEEGVLEELLPIIMVEGFGTAR